MVTAWPVLTRWAVASICGVAGVALVDTHSRDLEARSVKCNHFGSQDVTFDAGVAADE